MKRLIARVAIGTLVLATMGCATQPTPQPCASVGCPVSLPHRAVPRPDEACEASRIGGVVTADLTWGLGLVNGRGFHGVLWPVGYSARRQAGGIALVDNTGHEVGVEGDRIFMAGVELANGVFRPCNDPDLTRE